MLLNSFLREFSFANLLCTVIKQYKIQQLKMDCCMSISHKDLNHRHCRDTNLVLLSCPYIREKKRDTAIEFFSLHQTFLVIFYIHIFLVLTAFQWCHFHFANDETKPQ